MRFEDLTAGHFAEWDIPAPFDDDHMLGFAGRREDGSLGAIGLIFMDLNGRWWVSFHKRGECSPFVHKVMLKIKRALRELKVKEVWATLDDTVPGAREWLQRGGFVQTAEHEGAWKLWVG